MTQEHGKGFIDKIKKIVIKDREQVAAHLGKLEELYGSELVDYATSLAGGDRENLNIVQTDHQLYWHHPDRDSYCFVIKGSNNSVEVRGFSGVSKSDGEYWGLDVALQSSDLKKASNQGVGWGNDHKYGGVFWRMAKKQPFFTNTEMVNEKLKLENAPQIVEYKGRVIPH